jgi:hypothetical protein
VRSKFYFDEDSADKALVEALRARGVDVCVPAEVGLLITSNIDDFYRLHSDLLRQNGRHPGIAAIQQQSLGIGERMRRLIKLWSTLRAEEMINRIEFLSHW